MREPLDELTATTRSGMPCRVVERGVNLVDSGDDEEGCTRGVSPLPMPSPNTADVISSRETYRMLYSCGGLANSDLDPGQ
jgi:hypothetical protein